MLRCGTWELTGNVKILEKIFEYTKDRVDTQFNTTVVDVEKTADGFRIATDKQGEFECSELILATGRSGSKWIRISVISSVST